MDQSLPVLTHDLWQAACPEVRSPRGTRGQCNRCDLCRWHALLRARHHAAPWQAPEARVRPERTTRWVSVEDSLAAYARALAEGYAAPSAYAILLRDWQPTPAHPTQREDSRPIRAADDIVDVERCLARLWAPENDRGLDWGDCNAILIARLIGTPVRRRAGDGGRFVKVEPVALAVLSERYGVSESSIDGLVKDARRRLHEIMAIRGLVPVRRRL